jgi:Zn-dependent peptidase ImmA (M78 family)/transcriptional regulator with XRE-family HTH domain
MTTSTEDIGARIAEARNRAKLTQQQLASQAGLDRTALAKIERGQRGLAALELVDLASALGLRVEWLLSDAPAAVIAHRTRLDPELDISSIDKELERLSRDVEFLVKHDAQMLPKTLDGAELPTAPDAIEQLAEDTRKKAGLGTNEPAIKLADVVAQLGLLAYSKPLGADTADAASLLLSRGAVALINSSNAVGRRRLALAHELGHYLVKDDYSIDWRVADYANSDRTEVLLDRFARAFLAPRQAFATYWTRVSEDHDTRTSAVLAGSHFFIDMSTIARRLSELNLADSDVINIVRATRTTKADIVSHGLNPSYELDGITVPTNVAQSVLSQYRKERISAERALELLYGTFEREDLPPLPPGHENEIWSLLS